VAAALVVEVGVVSSDCCGSGVQAVAVRRMARATAVKGVGVGAGSRGRSMGGGSPTWETVGRGTVCGTSGACGAGARAGCVTVRSLGDVPEPDDPTAEEPVEDRGQGGEQSVAHEPRPVEGGTEVSDDQRDRRTGFFRERRTTASPVAALPTPTGGRWSELEADRQIRAFLTTLAGERTLVHRSDPVELLRENDLLLLFGPEEEEAFADLALRFPEETVSRWATLLSGGDRSEAFGPRSRSERRDEAAILRSIAVGLRKRVLGVVLVLFAVVAVGALARVLLSDDPVDRTDRSLRFSSTLTTSDSGGGTGVIPGGPPVAEPSLVGTADRVVAVLRGDGPPADRIRLDVPAAELPVPVAALAGTVFEHGGGQVALVGPVDWWDAACVRVVVATEVLRPLDVVLYESSDGACPAGMVGRPARVTCSGRRVLVLAVDIPQGEVPLIEGGSGWAETIRFGVETATGPASRWETLAVRGSITVVEEGMSVAVPRFGGGPGDEVTVDLGAGPSGPFAGDCTLE